MVQSKHGTGTFVPIAVLGNIEHGCHPTNMFKNFQFLIRNQDTGEDFTLTNLVISYFDNNDGLVYYRSIDGLPSSIIMHDSISLITKMLKGYLGDFLFETYFEGLRLVQWFEEKSIDRLGEGTFVWLFNKEKRHG